MSDAGGGMPLGYTFVEIRPLATRFNAQAAAAVQPGLTAIDRAFDLKAKSMDKRLQDVGKRASAFVSLPLAAGGVVATKAASSLVEQTNKVAVVFGSASKSVIDFSKNSSDAMGQSKRAVLEAAGTYGNLLKAAKIGEAQSAEMAKTLVALQSDIASFGEKSIEQAFGAIRSGLVGESEPLRDFGVNLNEAALKAEAMALGLYKGKGLLTDNAKAQAVYSIVLRQTAHQQGDFARTGDSLANQLKKTQANAEDAAASLGAKLIPAALRLVQAGNKVLDVFEDLPGPVQNVAVIGTVALAAAGPVIYLTGKVIQLRKALAGLQVQSALGGVGAAAGRAGTAAAAGSAAGAAAGGASIGAAAAATIPKIGLRMAGQVGALALVGTTIAKSANDAVPALEWLDRAAIGLQERIPVVGKYLGGLDRAVLGLGQSAKKVDLAKVGKEVGRLAEQLNRRPTGLTEALDTYQAKVNATFTVPIEANRALRSYLDSVDELKANIAARTAGADPSDLRRAQLDLADAQDRLNDARKTGVEATRAIADAERDLAKAERKAADVHFNALRRGADPDAARDADEAVEDARRRLADAREVNAREVARAQMDVEDARKRADELAAKARTARQPLIGTATPEQRATSESLDRVKEEIAREAARTARGTGDPRRVRSVSDFVEVRDADATRGASAALDDLARKVPELSGQIKAIQLDLGSIKPVSVSVGISEEASARLHGQLDRIRQPITVPVRPVVDSSLLTGADSRLAGLHPGAIGPSLSGPLGRQPTGSTATTQVVDNRVTNNYMTISNPDPNAVAAAIAREQAREAARAR